MRKHATAFVLLSCFVASAPAQDAAASRPSELAAPVRLLAEGAPIDIGKLTEYAHAGPWIADVDGDGKRDLIVGDFPGNFWVFTNSGTEKQPVYKAGRKLKAGGKDAVVEIY